MQFSWVRREKGRGDGVGGVITPSLGLMKKKANEVAGAIQAAEQTKANALAERTFQQARASDAASKLSEQRSKAAEAVSELEECSTERRELEAQIEQAAGPDHPVTLARQTLEQATADLKLWKNRVLESRAWKTKQAEAEKAGRSSAEIADLQTETLRTHPEHATAVARHARARTEYQRLRQELFSADARWQDAVISARRAQAEQADADQKSTGQARRQLNASSNAREATGTATQADATIKQGQATLKAMQERFKDYGGKSKLGKDPVPTPTTPAYRTKK